MKEVIVKLLLIALAISCLTAIAIPTVWQDGKDTKNRTQEYYFNMFQ
ncbi:hypothetical protein [Paenibacillus marinisediminis]